MLASGGYSWASGAPDSDMISAPSSRNATADEAMRYSMTGPNPPSRRRMRSSVQPRTPRPSSP